MSRITRAPVLDSVDYPTGDGKPMAETDVHLLLMLTLIPTLREYFKSQRLVYVGGNLLMFYERGNKRKHVSPDLFVVRGVGNHLRENYLIWEEGKAPELVIEFTSKSTRKEDLQTKYALYRDVLKVKECFLFDPNAEYLKPPLQGHRLRGGKYLAIRAVEGRLPSRVLGLHLERAGSDLRLWDPATGQWLLTATEARQQADEARQQADEARQQAEAEARREAAARRQAEAEVERLRREIEQLRRR
jgi:Uma2 family endonuclease